MGQLRGAVRDALGDEGALAGDRRDKNTIESIDLTEGDDESRIPKITKTSDAWDDYKEFHENGHYYAICLHWNKKLSRD